MPNDTSGAPRSSSSRLSSGVSSWIAIAHASACCRMVGRRDRRAPHREHLVAHVLHQRPAHREHELGDAVVVVVEHDANRARRQALRQRGEPAEVAEQHGHVEPLALGRGLRAVLVDESLRDGFGYVLREERGHPTTLPRLAEVAEARRAPRNATTIATSGYTRLLITPLSKRQTTKTTYPSAEQQR